MTAEPLDWQERADRHRPQAAADMTAEVRRLAGSGLKARDISTALRLDLAVVMQALQEEPAHG
ncbi:MAG TPA: hypothetical protein VFF72_08365 [Caldimonas sp.]|nr:hypothetical protein [Caldimonas sp.]